MLIPVFIASVLLMFRWMSVVWEQWRHPVLFQWNMQCRKRLPRCLLSLVMKPVRFLAGCIGALFGLLCFAALLGIFVVDILLGLARAFPLTIIAWLRCELCRGRKGLKKAVSETPGRIHSSFGSAQLASSGDRGAWKKWSNGAELWKLVYNKTDTKATKDIFRKLLRKDGDLCLDAVSKASGDAVVALQRALAEGILKPGSNSQSTSLIPGSIPGSLGFATSLFDGPTLRHVVQVLMFGPESAQFGPFKTLVSTIGASSTPHDPYSGSDDDLVYPITAVTHDAGTSVTAYIGEDSTLPDLSEEVDSVLTKQVLKDNAIEAEYKSRRVSDYVVVFRKEIELTGIQWARVALVRVKGEEKTLNLSPKPADKGKPKEVLLPHRSLCVIRGVSLKNREGVTGYGLAAVGNSTTQGTGTSDTKVYCAVCDARGSRALSVVPSVKDSVCQKRAMLQQHYGCMELGGDDVTVGRGCCRLCCNSLCRYTPKARREGGAVCPACVIYDDGSSGGCADCLTGAAERRRDSLWNAWWMFITFSHVALSQKVSAVVSRLVGLLAFTVLCKT